MDSSAWDARYASTAGLLWNSEPNRYVAEELADLPPGRALDLAAGEGRNAVWLAARGWMVTAVDFSRVAIERGQRLAAERGTTVEWIIADLRGYRPPVLTYDAVLVIYLHLPAKDQARVLANAAAAVAPGGTLLVVGHDPANLTDGVGGPQDPALLHSPEWIASALSDLKITRAETVRRPVTTDEGTQDALDAVVVGVRL
ncbi:MAG TPA: class I SAM-dependent methyltransferase [Micromonospora sp.]